MKLSWLVLCACFDGVLFVVTACMNVRMCRYTKRREEKGEACMWRRQKKTEKRIAEKRE